MIWAEYHDHAQNKIMIIIHEGLQRPNEGKYHHQNLVKIAAESAPRKQLDHRTYLQPPVSLQPRSTLIQEEDLNENVTTAIELHL